MACMHACHRRGATYRIVSQKEKKPCDGSGWLAGLPLVCDPGRCVQTNQTCTTNLRIHVELPYHTLKNHSLLHLVFLQPDPLGGTAELLLDQLLRREPPERARFRVRARTLHKAKKQKKNVHDYSKIFKKITVRKPRSKYMCRIREMRKRGTLANNRGRLIRP